MIVEWPRERAADLVALLPELTVEDATRVLWDDAGGFVLGPSDGSAAIAGIKRGDRGFVRCVAVAAGRRRAGTATALLRAAEDRLATSTLYVGGEAPFYLWPGVDAMCTDALAFFEARGFLRAGVELNMTCPAAHVAAPPPGICIDRVADGGRAIEFVRAQWPHWVPEAERAIELGTCFVATEGDDGGVVGFIGHSVNRRGWLGPMGTVPVKQGGGVGTALVAAVCADARAAGRTSVEIAWVGPVGFYAKAVGAVVSRAFVRMRSRSSR